MRPKVRAAVRQCSYSWRPGGAASSPIIIQLWGSRKAAAAGADEAGPVVKVDVDVETAVLLACFNAAAAAAAAPLPLALPLLLFPPTCWPFAGVPLPATFLVVERPMAEKAEDGEQVALPNVRGRGAWCVVEVEAEGSMPGGGGFSPIRRAMGPGRRIGEGARGGAGPCGVGKEGGNA